jgi:hypothetical protein
MKKGLEKEGSTVAMIPSYVEGRLTGKWRALGKLWAKKKV